MSETAICRVVAVDIVDNDHYSRRRGQKVEVEAPPHDRMAMDDHLGNLLPRNRIEHMGRKDFVQVGYDVRPTSLFFQAMHACFKGHHALTLRPEVLMHQIAGEVALTVKRNSEAYRHLFTISPEKKRIDVRHDGLKLGNPKSPWHEAIALFDPALREVVPHGIMEHLLPSFSTATVESRVASLVTFMDAASAFYDYHVHTKCGIPEIRLAGTPEDYRHLVTAAAQLSEVFRSHLGRYFDHLLPVLAKLADQAAGAPIDQHFWRSIYNYESHSGNALFNGWITAFVNYVQTAAAEGGRHSQAKYGEAVAKRDDLYDWENPGEGWQMKGLNLGSVPSHVSVVPFIWHYYGTEHKMLFAGGELAIDEQDGAIMPGLSYAVLHDK